jgi:hypothetical protein
VVLLAVVQVTGATFEIFEPKISQWNFLRSSKRLTCRGIFTENHFDLSSSSSNWKKNHCFSEEEHQFQLHPDFRSNSECPLISEHSFHQPCPIHTDAAFRTDRLYTLENQVFLWRCGLKVDGTNKFLIFISYFKV